MRTPTLAAAAAFVFATCIPAFATPTPTWTQRSYGFYNPSGEMSIEYWVDATDSTQSLNSVSAAGADEINGGWINSAHWTGTGSHMTCQGWCYCYDGDADGQVWITDYYINYHYTTEFHF